MLPFAILLTLAGCGLLGGGDKPPVTAAADEKLRLGDLSGAEAEYKRLLDEDPKSVDAAVGLAYMAYLGDDTDRAEAVLAAVETHAGERTGEVKLRRALVALKVGDTDQVRTHGEGSGLPAGKLLAAEVLLADGERDAATTLLEGLQGEAGGVGSTAKDYLRLLKDGDPTVAGLAENYALWALGQRKVAVRSVEEVVKALPDEREDKSTELLLWAGRAAAVGQAQVASNLLDSVVIPPEGNSWRSAATRGILLCAEGDAEGCLATFQALVGAPPDGLADAKITAAMALGDRSPDTTKALLEGLNTDSAALAAYKAGKGGMALKLAPEGLLRDKLSEE